MRCPPQRYAETGDALSAEKMDGAKIGAQGEEEDHVRSSRI